MSFPKILAAALALTLSAAPVLASGKDATVYKSPYCGCCTGHADHLTAHGYAVKVVEVEDIDAVKARLGVPEALQSCHSTIIGGYVVEGHVPVAAIDKMLAEKPKARGIALPGMPQGSPGMSGTKEGPFEVYTIEAKPKLFMVE